MDHRTNFATEERERRASLRSSRAAADARRGAEALARECEYRRRESDLAAAEVERLAALQRAPGGGKARRNRPSLPYDPVGQRYAETVEGQALRAFDKARWARDGLVGTAHIASRNPILG